MDEERTMHRRDVFRALAALALGGMVPRLTRSALAGVPAMSGPGPYGPLGGPDGLGLMLPSGFFGRVIARAGEVVTGTAYEWPRYPDGGAVFRARRGGWIYVANSEQGFPNGGVGAIAFDRYGEIVGAHGICSGTARNCAGGATPWGTWLTCEEVADGRVWECDPTGEAAPVLRAALGTFQHEAVTVDRDGRLYLTEDQPDGRLYRFSPTHRKRLDAGVLEVAAVTGTAVEWLPVPNPTPVIGMQTPTRQQVPASTPFNGGEGITCARRHVYFTTKGDNRIWDYDTRAARLTMLYDDDLDPTPQLAGVDNVTAARSGDLIVAEDGGNMELVMITPEGVVAPLVRVLGQAGSELTGPAFDRTGRRLYFSSQRGDGFGITYEVQGPFRRQARPA